MATVIKLKRSETPSSVPSTGSLEPGELCINVTDGKFYTKTTGNVIKEVGGAGSVTLQAVTDNESETDNDIKLNGSDLIFEGTTADAYETTLRATDPKRDALVMIPNASGRLAIDGDALAYSIVFGG